MEIKVKCSFKEMMPISQVVENPKNSNKHPDKQVKLLSKIIKYQGWRHPIIISNLSGFIVAGHGRLQAARLAGLDEVPVDYQDFDNAAQEMAFLESDNLVADLAEHDAGLMIENIKDLGLDDNFDLELFGVPDLDFSEDVDLGELYTRKVEAPIYEPSGDKLSLGDLFNSDKTNELLDEIEKSKISSELKQFLRLAAHRHNKFNYKNIAEYYSNCDLESQILIENSALVVIDFDKAIEKGFVKLTEKVREAYAKQK